jgi:hypothetical protein
MSLTAVSGFPAQPVKRSQSQSRSMSCCWLRVRGLCSGQTILPTLRGIVSSQDASAGIAAWPDDPAETLHALETLLAESEQELGDLRQTLRDVLGRIGRVGYQ